MTVLVLLLALLAVALRWGADTREGRDWQFTPPGPGSLPSAPRR